MVLAFYSTIGLLVALLCVKLVALGQQLVTGFPSLYANQIEPALFAFSAWLEGFFTRMDPSAAQTVNEVFSQAIQSLSSSVSTVSMRAIAAVSGWASSLPGFFVKLLLMIISTFFLAKDHDALAGFVLRQFPERGRALLLHIREYLVGTLLICIRSYALIMSITFLELSTGLTLIGWSIRFPPHCASLSLYSAGSRHRRHHDSLDGYFTASGRYALGVGLAVVYLAVTVIRNILEPKIVGRAARPAPGRHPRGNVHRRTAFRNHRPFWSADHSLAALQPQPVRGSPPVPVKGRIPERPHAPAPKGRTSRRPPQG